jgi:hypothetical protein
MGGPNDHPAWRGAAASLRMGTESTFDRASPMTRAAAGLLGLLCLAGCGGGAALSSSDGPDEGFGWRSLQVQRDVEAITQGMNHARAQSEAVARARMQ